jgi:hypothetical protein
MSAQRSFGFILFGLLAGAAACDDGTDIGSFSYGGNQPGEGLAEGGEIRHENVRILGLPEQTWMHVYQYKGPAATANAPFPGPIAGSQYGNCVDERDPATATWPFKPITGATYLDLPQVKVTGTGISGTLDVVKTDPPNTAGNSTFRMHDFTYGGGAPGDPPSGFNGTLNAAASTPGGSYTLDIGQGPMTYNMPAAYTTPLGIGGAAKVMIPNGADLEMNWTAPANDMGANDVEHTRKTHFNFTFFADPTAAFPPQFICFPDVDGHQVVPASVINELPAGGLIVHANLSHYLEAQDADGEQRRFDLVSIFCNISLFEKQ